MNSAFSEDILADKLAKLNNTQQCIESILALLFSGQICVFWVVLWCQGKFTVKLQFLRLTSLFYVIRLWKHLFLSARNLAPVELLSASFKRMSLRIADREVVRKIAIFRRLEMQILLYPFYTIFR